MYLSELNSVNFQIYSSLLFYFLQLKYRIYLKKFKYNSISLRSLNEVI